MYYLSDESESLSPLALIALLDVNTPETSKTLKKNFKLFFFQPQWPAAGKKKYQKLNK